MYIGYVKYYSSIRFGDDSEAVYGAVMIMKNKIVSARFISNFVIETYLLKNKQVSECLLSG